MAIEIKSLLNFEEIDEATGLKALEELRKICNNCIKCELAKTRTKVVFSGGTPTAKIMLIGEAPGKNEDETGEPFVGRAGTFLNELLLAQGISREKNLYICNTVKCRPPENRVPTEKEKEACRVYLEGQIQLIRPNIILLCGATAVKSFLKTKLGISKIRGQWFEGPLGSKMMPIFHPSYLLRKHSMEEDSPRWLMNKDIQAVKMELDASVF